MAQGPATRQRACVYTSMLGGYEKLNEQPIASRSSVPFLCLTDDPAITSDTWKTIVIEPCFPLDPVRSQRMLKLLPHRFLPDYDISLYIDNTVILKEPPELLLERYLPPGIQVALPTHSYRETVLSEFAEVGRLGLDDPVRMSEQLNHYSASSPAALLQRPYWSAIQFRRHHDEGVRCAFELWCAHVLRYSRRDQLSANVAFEQSRLSPDRIEIDNYESWFHTWPHVADRTPRSYFRPADAL